MTEIIEIRKLRVATYIGVPETERAAPQEVALTVLMTPEASFATLNDEINRTVDYHAVANELIELAAAKPRQLIETLATEVADHIVSTQPVRKVEVLVEKFILPETECVAVRTVRERSSL